MKILIAGVGALGISVLERLVARNFEILVLDYDRDTIGQLEKLFHTCKNVTIHLKRAYLFNMLNPKLLQDVKLVMALSPINSLNLLVSLKAKEYFSNTTIISISSDSYIAQLMSMNGIEANNYIEQDVNFIESVIKAELT